MLGQKEFGLELKVNTKPESEPKLLLETSIQTWTRSCSGLDDPPYLNLNKRSKLGKAWANQNPIAFILDENLQSHLDVLEHGIARPVGPTWALL